MHLQIVTPFGKVLDTDCDEATVPGAQGQLGILPKHIPLLTDVDGGVLSYRHGGELRRVSVANGFCEVHADRILLIVSSAEKDDAIDVPRAKENLAQAEAELARLSVGAQADDPRVLTVRRRILRETARIEAAAARKSG